MLKDRAAIVGIGQSRFAKSLESSEQELTCEVVLAACEDAGIDPSEIDGMVSFTSDVDEISLAKSIGAGDLTFFAKCGWGGGAGVATVGVLAMAIASGQCDVGVCWRTRKRGAPTARPWANSTWLPADAVADEFSRPFGMLRPADQIAALARRYMHEFGVTREQLAAVPLAIRRHANKNPAAVMHDQTLDLETYLAARWISEPLCLYDCSLESDGAVAVVMVSAERARDLRQPPAYVHSFAQGQPRQQHSMVNYYNERPLYGPSWVAGPALWSRSDMGPADMDFAQFYDVFSPLILLSLEGYGFCGRGEAGDFVADGGIEVGGRLPVNTSGGSLSEAFVHGFNLILEGVRQIRGTSTNQVPGASAGLVSSAEIVPTAVMVLRS